MEKKLKITIACWGTVIATAIIFAMILILLGFRDKLESYFYFHFTIGVVVIFLIFWPFYSKKLK